MTSDDDRGYNAIEVREHVTRGNAKRRKAEPSHLRVPLNIAIRPIAPAVRLAIDLDRQSRGEAGEVEAVAAERVLAAESEAAWAQTERAPQHDLRQVAGAAFATRA